MWLDFSKLYGDAQKRKPPVFVVPNVEQKRYMRQLGLLILEVHIFNVW
ncbi:hypothetical protein OMS_00738 [Enterococcus durans ATCC 6056]|uniref:Uncharacterized protein n=1 Tax=Enterococcus durans ATCC 6056 TaxID=1140001 RepID=A0ABP2V2N1_9ENTE|nr:hypothetical protein OMS_00738 [Enterococcus durans ATCC 6056]EOU19486.1 hypothetical protein I571_02489 [Enterococcus durans ATCC 6056]